MRVGATYLGNDCCEFTVWAPHCSTVALKLLTEPETRLVSLRPNPEGYWHGMVSGVPAGTRYGYLLNDVKVYPDPTSHWQSEGVHGLSVVVDHDAFIWTDETWRNPPLRDYLIYELHVGTFTPEGTFDAIIPRLPRLVELGITALELMPVAQFPGERNWGYDGVYPYAVQHSYGGPEGLKRLVNACHNQGLAVILDVVYNHLGPEGNYATTFAPYFTEKYRTPWGQAMNYDDRFSGGVRNFVMQNILHWLRHYHIDALRLDAIQTIYDCSAQPILAVLSEGVEQWSHHHGKPIYLIAETDNNDARVLRSRQCGGWGFSGQWSDDFHHGLHALLTGEGHGYFQDFGNLAHFAQCLEQGFTYNGQFSPFRQCHRGNDARDRPLEQFIVCIQNHDQVGNRIQGERLHHLINPEAYKLAVTALLLSPYVPMLFMGEEYGEPHPFLYFVDHDNPELVQAVHEGRKREFENLHLQGDPPFVGDKTTFLQSQLQWDLPFTALPGLPLDTNPYQQRWRLYQHLIQLRRRIVPSRREQMTVRCHDHEGRLQLHYDTEAEALLFFNVQAQGQTWDPQAWETLPQSCGSPGIWYKVFDSTDPQWSHTPWMGKPTAPDTLDLTQTQGKGDQITLQGYHAAVYQRLLTERKSYQ